VQGSSPSGRRSGGQFIIWLAAAHVAAATIVVFALSSAAPLTAHAVPHKLMLAALVTGSLVGIVADARAVKKRWFSLGLSRQTPKVLLRLGEHAWITPLVWGFDTGLVWTTFRVSFCSWMLLLLALAGVAPPWAGSICGLAFATPLLGSVLLSRRHLPVRGQMSPVPAQLLGIASMGLLVVLASKLILEPV
jgi:hypothetical protein